MRENANLERRVETLELLVHELAIAIEQLVSAIPRVVVDGDSNPSDPVTIGFARFMARRKAAREQLRDAEAS